MISFDNASTTSVDDEVLDVYVNCVKQFNTHPDSDPQLLQLREDVKNNIRSLLNINHNLCFTSGGTESNNLAIIGFAKKFSSPKHFITSSYEHPSVLNSFKYLETLGHSVDYVTPNQDGIIEPEKIISLLQDNTVMVSIMSVNNEIGSLNPIGQIASEIKQYNPNIVMMSDCVQGISYLSTQDLNTLDIFTISGHKLHGLKGCGLLAYKANIKIDPILYGGHNEHNLRPGTQDLAREVAFVKAIEKYVVNKPKNLMQYLLDQLATLENVCINCKSETHIINISIETQMLAESIKNYLYNKGMMVSTKSACSSVDASRSYTLLNLKLDDQTIDHSIRISLDSNISKKDIDDLIMLIKEI